MTQAAGRTGEGASVAERRLERLADARWPLGAAALAIFAAWASGRIGPFEALLAALFVVLATLLAPARRRLVARDRNAASTGVVVVPEALALLEALPEPVLVLNLRGVVLAANGHARAALGAISEGDPVSFAVRTPEVLDAVRAAPSAAEPQTVLYVERAPVERWREAHVATAKGPGGAVAIVVAFRDLTEQRRSERMRVDFIANASHELRTPLASLLGFIETLQGPARNDPDARDRFLVIMRAQANRMSRLIGDLLSLSRIELNAHVRPRDVVDLSSLAAGVADALGPLASERKVVVTVETDAEPVLVRGDRDELIRVAENLIENAIKYGQSGGRVDVAVRRGVGRAGARLVVRDYGPGIPAEHVPRLTERFYRVDAADSREKGGTGLGLALVKHILQRHRGRLSIDSKTGEGATFTVTLDRADPDAPRVESAASVPAR